MKKTEQVKTEESIQTSSLPLAAVEASLLSGGQTKFRFESPLPPYPPFVGQRLGRIGKMSQQVKNATLLAAVVSGVETAIQKFGKVRSGELTKDQYAGAIAKASCEQGVECGAKTGGALLIKEGGKMLGKKIGTQGLRRFFGSNAGTVVAFAVIEQAQHTVQFFRGNIDGGSYLQKTAENAGTAGGAYGGALGGAALGTMICPVVGTAVGAFVGGLGGALGGGALMSKSVGWLRRR